MDMKSLLKLVCLGAVALVFAAVAANAGPELKISDDSWISLSFLGQAHYRVNSDAADEEDFFLRRGRIIVQGQVQDGVKFFVETDNDNAGKNGSPAVSTDIQDAWMDYRLVKTDAVEAWLQGGLMLLPFSLDNRGSAASLLGIDYNSEVIKFVNSFTWRDYGAELHGNVLKKVAYHLGVFDGYDEPNSTKNNDAALRYCGHVAFNVIGEVEQGGWFYTQNRLGKVGKDNANYLILGAGLDTQDKATLNPAVSGVVTNMVVRDSDAWVVDMQSSFALGDAASLLVNAGFYDWDNGAYKGTTAFVESGVLIGKTMVTGKFSPLDPDTGANADDYTAGLHYFIKGHNARVGVEYTWGDTAATDGQILGGLQFLL